jgi:serine/threonine-protein kinase
MGDQELRGLALGLATAINGSPADMIENVEELADEVAHQTSTSGEGRSAPADAALDAAPDAASGAGPEGDGLEPTRAMPTPTSTPVPTEREDTARGA